MNKKIQSFETKYAKQYGIFYRINVKFVQPLTSLLTASRDKNKYEIIIILLLKKATAVSMNYVCVCKPQSNKITDNFIPKFKYSALK